MSKIATIVEMLNLYLASVHWLSLSLSYIEIMSRQREIKLGISISALQNIDCLQHRTQIKIFVVKYISATLVRFGGL